jgi:hypothetical protein
MMKDRGETPSPAWHNNEVRIALEDHERDPAAGRPWADLRAELKSKLRQRE